MMLRKIALTSMALFMMVIASACVSAEGEMVEKSDPEGDTGLLVGISEENDDVDLTYGSADWSGEKVKVVLKVKGEFLTAGGPNTTFLYFIKLDTTLDTRGEEITIMYNGNVSVISDAGMDLLVADVDYEITEHTLTVLFDKKHLEEHDIILDITADAIDSDGITDFLEPDTVGGTTDDDETDDEREKDTPGPGVISVILAFAALLIISVYRRRMN
ncbi:MAG: hypothetical protein KAH57_03745 [Thermoplasmata archaeon]|nr:hypothetical protein [Thermoplasmata archaeon]